MDPDPITEEFAEDEEGISHTVVSEPYVGETLESLEERHEESVSAFIVEMGL